MIPPRRNFICATAATSVFSGLNLCAATGSDELIGHGDYRYQVDTAWSKANRKTHPVNNCHDVCVDTSGNLYVCQWAAGKVYPYKLTKTG